MSDEPVGRPSGHGEGFSVEVTNHTGKPPIFGNPEDGLWSLGSAVWVHYFRRADDGNVVETREDGLVTGIRESMGPGRWTVTVTFGPALDMVYPTEFSPSQITAIAPPPGDAGKTLAGIDN